MTPLVWFSWAVIAMVVGITIWVRFFYHREHR